MKTINEILCGALEDVEEKYGLRIRSAEFSWLDASGMTGYRGIVDRVEINASTWPKRVNSEAGE